MRFLLLPFLFLLASCDNPPSGPAIDGYHFEEEQFVQTNFTTEIVLRNNMAELRRNAPDEIKNVRGLSAYAQVSRGKCTIYVVDPRKFYEPHWLGHELTHCMFGSWHIQQDKERPS